VHIAGTGRLAVAIPGKPTGAVANVWLSSTNPSDNAFMVSSRREQNVARGHPFPAAQRAWNSRAAHGTKDAALTFDGG
jgi:hypothetical protein